LPEFFHLLAYLKHKNIIPVNKKLMYLTVNHTTEQLKLITKEKGELKEVELPFYKSIMDPRVKIKE
jgi:hypothetical protein